MSDGFTKRSSPVDDYLKHLQRVKLQEAWTDTCRQVLQVKAEGKLSMDRSRARRRAMDHRTAIHSAARYKSRTAWAKGDKYSYEWSRKDKAFFRAVVREIFGIAVKGSDYGGDMAEAFAKKAIEKEVYTITEVRDRLPSMYRALYRKGPSTVKWFKDSLKKLAVQGERKTNEVPSLMSGLAELNYRQYKSLREWQQERKNEWLHFRHNLTTDQQHRIYVFFDVPKHKRSVNSSWSQDEFRLLRAVRLKKGKLRNRSSKFSKVLDWINAMQDHPIHGNAFRALRR